MRVTTVSGSRETEAYLDGGHVTLLGGGALPVREFFRHWIVQPERRGCVDRRQTLERRRIPSLARRNGVPRRRVDHLTTGERMALLRGVEFTVEDGAA